MQHIFFSPTKQFNRGSSTLSTCSTSCSWMHKSFKAFSLTNWKSFWQKLWLNSLDLHCLHYFYWHLMQKYQFQFPWFRIWTRNLRLVILQLNTSVLVSDNIFLLEFDLSFESPPKGNLKETTLLCIWILVCDLHLFHCVLPPCHCDSHLYLSAYLFNCDLQLFDCVLPLCDCNSHMYLCILV